MRDPSVKPRGPLGCRCSGILALVPTALPPRVEFAIDGPVAREYWAARIRQHRADTYAGVSMLKFPEDLRVYEHLLWQTAPSAVIEVGVKDGGSALWFRDRLRTLEAYGRVRDPLMVAIDVEIADARAQLERVDPLFGEHIALVEGDIRDPATAARVAQLMEGREGAFVVEDSEHIYDTTMASLNALARYVPRDGYFVVEDGAVDVEELRVEDDWPRGVLPALRDWLQTPEGGTFTVRRDLELYGLSAHPSGFLQRTAPTTAT
jgi:cephalosporin hydroxylase